MSTEIRRLIDSWREQAGREGLRGQRTRPKKPWEVLDACATQLEALLTSTAEPSPTEEQFVVPKELVDKQMADMSAWIRKLEADRDRAEAAMLQELHCYVASMPLRVERLGGQRTSYVQRATLLDWLEVELEKRLAKPAEPSPVDAQPEDDWPMWPTGEANPATPPASPREGEQ